MDLLLEGVSNGRSDGQHRAMTLLVSFLESSSPEGRRCGVSEAGERGASHQLGPIAHPEADLLHHPSRAFPTVVSPHPRLSLSSFSSAVLRAKQKAHSQNVQPRPTSGVMGRSSSTGL